MAPRLIPPEPQFASRTERVLWQALKAQLPTDAFLAANQHLHCHEDFYEADLVVGLPDLGFAVIEVKGGYVERREGTWWQAQRDGMKAIDPAGQADRGKRLLDSFARAHGWSHGPIRFESLVAFPDMDLGPEPPGPDVPRWAVLGKNDLDAVATRVRYALDHKRSEHPRPSTEMVAEMADLLGGRGDPQAARLGVEQARADYVRHLTDEQYTILQAFRSNPCVLATGGPGTGKTWLALEQARRYAIEGHQVLFVCYSRGLSRWLAKAVAVMEHKVARQITVQTFHSIGLSLGIDVPEDADQHWWDQVLPEQMVGRTRPAFDALVVDEAQDFADSWWPPLLAMLRKQRMFVAGDDQQAVFAHRRGRPPVSLVELSLRENLRNTEQIAAVFNPLADDRMRFLGGAGPPVRFVPCSAQTAHDVADREVERLLEEGHPAGHIALLTTQHRHEFHRAAEQTKGKDFHWDAFWMDDEVFYGTVMGFKGLERPVVVLAVDGFHDDVARDVMYAGLSRARDQLVVCGDLDMIRAATNVEVARRLGRAR